MRRIPRVILAFLVAALPAVALDAAPLQCTTEMSAAPMACSGPTCCCAEQGACLCPRPATPAPPSTPASPALTSTGVDLHCDLHPISTWLDFTPLAIAAKCATPDHAAAYAPPPGEHLCVLQV